MSLIASITRGELENITDIDAVQLFAATFAAELTRLKSASATVESGSTLPPGCLGSQGDTPSRFILEDDFPEVNRTLISMLAVKWLLQDDYVSFTNGQKTDGKLSAESFQRLRGLLLARLPNADDIYAFLVLMVVDDIGKDPHLLDEAATTTGGTDTMNHSEAVFAAAKLGLIPALKTLPPSFQNDVLRALDVGARLNISQLAQAETVPAALNCLSDMHGRARFWDMRVMATFLDVAGAAAHANARGCVAMTESVFQTYMTTTNILEEFVCGRIDSPRACYDSILQARAEVLLQDGFAALSTMTGDDGRAFLRLLCMARVVVNEQAGLFAQAFSDLPPAVKQNLVNGLNVDGVSDGIAIVPYYAPGLWAETLRNTADKTDTSLVRAISAFMRFLARVFDGSRSQPGEPGAVVERDLSFAQATIKAVDFRANPDVLDEIGLPWE
ncbi:hypothetical protein PHISP_01562 [Aspergillus sp. HF37]|nr:hypothetical protein PHISP_01562 [Aspergillus sp. HF37]